MRSELQYIADSIYIEKLLKDDTIVSLAQDSSVASSVIGMLKSYVFSVFDTNRPIASLASLFTSGLLWNLKSKKLAILYTLAGALGFDWKAFWGKFGEEMTSFAKEIMSAEKKPDAATTNSKVNQIATNAVSSSFTGSPDPKALSNLANTMPDSNQSDDIGYVLANIRSSNIIKTAGIKSKIASVIIRITGWLGITVLGMIAGYLVYKHFSPDEKSNTPGTPHGLGNLIKMSPNASQELFSVHRNDMSSIWIEHGDIEDIDNTLLGWIFSAYPQFQKYKNKLVDSSIFNSMVDKFKERNKLANGLNLISIPRPFQRKIDIVSIVIRGFINEFSQKGSIPAEAPTSGTILQ